MALATTLALAACGGNDEHTTDAPVSAIDSRVTDGPPGPDASTIDAPPMIDAMPVFDAVPSTVTVVAGPCAGGADHTLTNSGFAFNFDGGLTPTPPITIAVGENIEFTSMLGHNFANASGPRGEVGFRSGDTFVQHTACLTFAAATGLTPITYVCQAHPLTMTNTLTVN